MSLRVKCSVCGGSRRANVDGTVERHADRTHSTCYGSRKPPAGPPHESAKRLRPYSTEVTCPTCGAYPGVWCQWRQGSKRCTTSHPARKAMANDMRKRMGQPPVTIPTTSTTLGGFPISRDGHYTCRGVIVTVEGTRNWFGVGGWTEEGEGRIEQDGPMVKGPVAYLFPRSMVLADNPEHSSAGDMRRAKEAGLHFHLHYGDRVELAGAVFVLVPPKRSWCVDYPKLEVFK